MDKVSPTERKKKGYNGLATKEAYVHWDLTGLEPTTHYKRTRQCNEWYVVW